MGGNIGYLFKWWSGRVRYLSKTAQSAQLECAPGDTVRKRYTPMNWRCWSLAVAALLGGLLAVQAEPPQPPADLREPAAANNGKNGEEEKKGKDKKEKKEPENIRD